jgi:hypothetical protein
MKKAFQFNMYDGSECFFNSTQNKRGVGILINKKIDFVVQDQKLDPEENYLLLRIQLKGADAIVGSIYGPNIRNEIFFLKIEDDIKNLSGPMAVPIILGGDWNCTPSPDPVDSNIDIFRMADIPNKRHSELVVELCTRLRICDPYRILNFNKKDFTYVPRCIRNENKSRIDFF